jgi:WD40 repeat protein
VLAFGLGMASPAAQAAEPTTAPLPRIEAGMHTAVIKRIATDTQGRWAVTASDDKTARLWEVASGKLLGVLRPPQDVGREGKLYAVAMSPDGRQVALAGWTGWDWSKEVSIYLYDRATQQLQRRLTGLPNVVNHLAYSADGRWLAAGLGEKGVRIFDTRTGALTGSDSNYGGGCYSVEFSPAGSAQAAAGRLELLSSSWDGQLRIHRVGDQGQLGSPRVARALEGGKRPFAARFSPDGRRVAVGFADSTAVQVLAADDLREVLRPDVTGVGNGFLGGVAWSADGQELVAGGQWLVDGKLPMRRWSAHDGRKLGDTPLTGDTVMDLVALPAVAGGGWLFAGFDPAWGVVDGQGRVKSRQDRPLADLRGFGKNLVLSESADRLRFWFKGFGNDPFEFDVARREVLTGQTEGISASARTSAPGLDVQDWNDQYKPRLNGQAIELDAYEISRSLAISADGQRFALGTEWALRLYDRSGRLQWRQAGPAIAWAVNLSRDGRWVVAAYADGTIRWYRVEDGREVLALFAHIDKKRWVLWTPEGFYAASAPGKGVGGGEELLGYHINRGQDRTGEFVTAAQLSETFHNPALVSKRLSPEGDALMAEAKKTIGTVDKLLARAQSIPPALTVKLPPGGRLEGDTEVTVEMTLEDRGGGIGPVRLFVDGHLVEGRQGASSEGVTATRRYTLRLAPGARNIELQPTSLRGVAGNRSAPIPALLRGAQASGTLHILAVGVQAYQDKSLNPLLHSVNDASKVAAEIARRAQPLFKTALPEPIVLTERQATREGIDAAFEQLKSRMKPEDTLVIFLAGHGQARVGQYSYLPWDYQPGAAGKRGEGLNEKRLFEMLQQSPARTLLLLDTCDAGGMVDMLAGAYERMSKERQRPVIGASRKGEFAREGYKGHGVFSAALLAILGRDGGGDELTVMELYPQLKRLVDRFSGEIGGAYFQTVQGHVLNGDFPVVRR